MKVKEESGKVGLKFNIQKTKIMLSGPITSWQIEEGKMEIVKNGNSLFSWAQKSPWTVSAAMKSRDACSLKEKL